MIDWNKHDLVIIGEVEATELKPYFKHPPVTSALASHVPGPHDCMAAWALAMYAHDAEDRRELENSRESPKPQVGWWTTRCVNENARQIKDSDDLAQCLEDAKKGYRFFWPTEEAARRDLAIW